MGCAKVMEKIRQGRMLEDEAWETSHKMIFKFRFSDFVIL